MVFQSADEGAVLELLPSQKRKEHKARVFAKTGFEAEKNIKEKKRKRCFRKNNIIKKKTRKRKPPSEKDGGK